MRDDPIDGEVVALVVTVESEEDVSTVIDRIESVGGTVAERLRFGAVRVEITQERIDDLCECSGIESIETEHAIGLGDAGEDI